MNPFSLARKGFLKPAYLPMALRYLWLRLRRPDIEFEGFAFVGPRVEFVLESAKARLVIGRWTHIGEGTALRAHEGVLRIGDKCVLGRDVIINTYLDLEIGDAAIIADRCYLGDFDHRTDDTGVPIKDQGLVKSPVRIGADCWLGTQCVVVRGADLGTGSVAAALSVVRGTFPPGSIVAGVPGRVVANRHDRYADAAELRAYVAGLGREAADRARRAMLGDVPDGADPSEQGVETRGDREVTGG
ncbi:acyltransferase [Microlunatus sp. Y2014]|uniref:acyltransferase n=1 Tax=Microlunatus sp. Y2014 TaxID=3418488 RepID=UPI003DA79961